GMIAAMAERGPARRSQRIHDLGRRQALGRKPPGGIGKSRRGRRDDDGDESKAPKWDRVREQALGLAHPNLTAESAASSLRQARLGYLPSLSLPSVMLGTRPMRPASSRLWVAIIAASPTCFTSLVSSSNTSSEVL